MAQNLFLESENPVEFLYLDRQRIASLIGQLSERGVLTGYKSVTERVQNFEGKAGASVVVAKADGKLSRTASESAEETYDPFWTHAYSFIQDLEANFAVPLEKARLGSLVKFEGLVQFLDLGLMRNLWELSAQAFLQSQPQPESRRNTKKTSPKPPQLPAEAKLGLQILREIPHLFHMTFLTSNGFRLWAAVQPDNLTISSSDLTMKFGAVMDGIWTVIGIVDAGVKEPSPPLPVNETLDGIISAMTNFRRILGRPQNHFGLTPLAIYTPIHGLAEAEAESAAAESSDTSSPDHSTQP